MHHIRIIFIVVLLTITTELISQNQYNTKQKYYNLKNENKSLTNIIDECHLQIANNLTDEPYEIYTLGKILIKGEKKISNGYFHITTEILKTKNNYNQDIFQLGSWLYFTKLNQPDNPILINILYGKTDNISLENLRETYNILTKFSKNKISDITKIPVKKYKYEEYWGD